MLIPGVRRIEWYAHGAGGAAVHELNEIPDGIPALQGSRVMPSCMTARLTDMHTRRANMAGSAGIWPPRQFSPRVKEALQERTEIEKRMLLPAAAPDAVLRSGNFNACCHRGYAISSACLQRSRRGARLYQPSENRVNDIVAYRLAFCRTIDAGRNTYLCVLPDRPSISVLIIVPAPPQPGGIGTSAPPSSTAQARQSHRRTARRSPCRAAVTVIAREEDQRRGVIAPVLRRSSSARTVSSR